MKESVFLDVKSDFQCVTMAVSPFCVSKSPISVAAVKMLRPVRHVAKYGEKRSV